MIPSTDTLRRAGEILQEIEKLQQEMASLFGGSSGATPASARSGSKSVRASADAGRPAGKRRSMSPEARARIAAAARARWARYRSEKKGGAK